jgi:uncharacterized protein YbbC (DUF1343 family)
VVGAPWIDGRALADELVRAGLAGVSFEATSFTPSENRHKGELCHGIRLHVDDRAVFEPVRTGLAMALALRKLHPKDWDGTRLRRMVGDPAVAQAILDRRPLSEVEALWQDDLDIFRAKRAKYLLYGP